MRDLREVVKEAEREAEREIKEIKKKRVKNGKRQRGNPKNGCLYSW